MDDHLTDETLNEYLDAALTLKQQHAVRAHLKHCPACAARLEALRVLFARLEALPSADLERDLTSAVLMALPAVQPAPAPGAVAPPWPRLVLGLVLTAQVLSAALLSIAARPFVVSLLSRAPWLSLPQPAAWLADLAARLQAALAPLLQPPAGVERLNAMAEAWLAALKALVEAVWPAGAGLPLPSIDSALALVAAGAAVWLAGNTLLLRQPIAHLLRRRR